MRVLALHNILQVKQNSVLTKTQLKVRFFEGNLTNDLSKGDENISEFSSHARLASIKIFLSGFENVLLKRTREKNIPMLLRQTVD